MNQIRETPSSNDTSTTSNVSSTNRPFAQPQAHRKFQFSMPISAGIKDNGGLSGSNGSSITTNPYRSSLTSNWKSPLPTIAATGATTANGNIESTNTTSNTVERNMNHSTTNVSSTNMVSQDLESKLHATAASFRQSRDTAHRNCTMAQERLRIAKEEYTTIQSSIKSLQNHIQSLEQTYSNDKTKHTEFQKEIQQLSNEVRFQHTELVSKRNQLHEQRNSGPLSEQATKERQDLLDRLHNTIQQQHNTIHNHKAQKAKGLNASLNVHRTALIELWNEKIPIGQIKPSSSTTRRWIKCIQNSTSILQEQLNDGSYNHEMNKLNYLKQKYKELIQSNIVSNPSNDETSKSDTSTIAMSHIDDSEHHDDIQMDVSNDARIVVVEKDMIADTSDNMSTNQYEDIHHPMIVDNIAMVA